MGPNDTYSLLTCAGALGRLAALEICVPAVAVEFATLAGALGMLPPEARAAAAAQASARALRPLETLFPFDPYLLRRSAAALDLKRAPAFLPGLPSLADMPKPERAPAPCFLCNPELSVCSVFLSKHAPCTANLIALEGA